MQYQYSAKESTGALSSGIIDAVSIQDARKQLQQRGLFALSLNEHGKARSADDAPKGKRKKVKRQDILTLTTQLTIMCQSGIDLAEALKNVSEQCPNLNLKEALEEIYDDVSAGQPVSKALKKHANLFGDAYIAALACSF